MLCVKGDGFSGDFFQPEEKGKLLAEMEEASNLIVSDPWSWNDDKKDGGGQPSHRPIEGV
jgi:hypothetical protein